jgi:hypothetical protein
MSIEMFLFVMLFTIMIAVAAYFRVRAAGKNVYRPNQYVDAPRVQRYVPTTDDIEEVVMAIVASDGELSACPKCGNILSKSPRGRLFCGQCGWAK